MNVDLFDYVRTFKWDEFIKSITDTTDVNIKDDGGNYLIQYIILYNNPQALNKILPLNPLLNWLDLEGKTILFEPIKYNYIDTINILLEHDKQQIGENIVNIKDKYGNYPIHYALIMNNKDVFELLVTVCKLSIIDRNGNTIIHLIAKGKSITFLSDLLMSKININMVNNEGFTPLHLACIYDSNDIIQYFLDNKADPNIYEKNSMMSPIFVCLLNGNNEGVNKIFNCSIPYKINMQEIEGNTLLHLSIIENNHEITNEIMTHFGDSIDYNITNKSGNTALHIIFQKIISNDTNIDNYNMSVFLTNTNINIQNNSGHTCWHYLIKLDVFANFTDILTKKKNNIFVLNKKNMSPYDLLNSKNQHFANFQNMIAESYYHTLINNTGKTWMSDIDIKCASNNYNKQKCLSLIKKYIFEEKKSYPASKKKYCIDIVSEVDNSPNNFTGISLDVLTSYIYLLKHYETLSSSIGENFKSNIHVSNLYTSMGVEKNLSFDYQNFEILWVFMKLVFPTTLEQHMKEFIENKDKKILAIPLGIDMELGAHSNIIIIDKTFKTIERFEPNGAQEPYRLNYNGNVLDFSLSKYFSNHFQKYEYLKPKDTQEIIGFQTLEMQENAKKKKIGDPEGFCVGWCLWYLVQRLTYLVHPCELSLKLKINIKGKNLSFKDLIRSFMNTVLSERNSLLEELELDVNDVVNENITDKQLQDLEQSIKAIIMNI
jgi:ankyrin repeat protein